MEEVTTARSRESQPAVSPRNKAYPPELQAREREIWQGPERPQGRAEPAVGFGLSGGGIRSATFCLGVFQALVRNKELLRRIDYISSVSGGGFFASFYGRLFSRPDVDGLADITRILSPDENTRLQFRSGDPDHVLRNGWKAEIFVWLRENGRYLAPNGSGDLLTGVTVFLRNWLTVQLLIASTFLAIFLMVQAVRVFWPDAGFRTGFVWWSPLFELAAAVTLIFVMPLGWAYWTFTDPDPGTAQPGPAQGNGSGTTGRILLSRLGFGFRSFFVLLALAASLLAASSILIPDYVWTVTIGVLELTFIFWQLALLFATSKPGFWRSFIVAAAIVLSLLTAYTAWIQVYTDWGETHWYLEVGRKYWYLPVMLGAILFGVTSFGGLFLPAVEQRDLLNESETARGKLSRWLRTALVVAVVLASFALLDTAGETLYALGFTSSFRPWHWIVAAAGLVATVSPYARSLLGFLTPKKGSRLSPSLSLVAGAAAVVVILPYLVLLNSLSHAISYKFEKPSDTPAVASCEKRQEPTKNALDNSIANLEKAGAAAGYSAVIVAVPGNVVAGAKPCQPVPSDSRHLGPLMYFLALTGVFIFFTGSSISQAAWVFLNRTSLHALYAARLIRAYLGASNKFRFLAPPRKPGFATTPSGVTDPVDGDDIPQEDYFVVPRAPSDPPSPGKPSRPRDSADTAAQNPPDAAAAQAAVNICAKGAPLHLINVTINETIDGRSNTEQRDRKGLGMAVGPAGFSAGVHHHVVFSEKTRLDQNGVFSPVKIFPPAHDGYRIFGPDQPEEADAPPAAGVSPSEGGAAQPGDVHAEKFEAQRLSLGNWTAISGAAVSTGLGGLTSLGTSILTAFFNLRLGYWWDSGTPSLVPRRQPGGRLGTLLARMLPVQSSLLDEFLGRFRGTIRRYWYLTDGGHFENMGGYELIRRRLPVIVLIDAGADPNYEFADLANLIRKARLDFNAEIEFLVPAGNPFATVNNFIGDRFSHVNPAYCGTLDQLRPQGHRRKLSPRHAAVARIRYLDDPKSDHYLVLIKPSLTGDEPEDLTNYHGANPSFPQQTTAEQFFDEAQWESYRRLGQHITELVFGIN
ncbi:MAG TPA: patatin-like phospholipase family protein [Candidatus Binataceae bacterium]|nr:patatin-like phospholipase family protein [Candidatus Binataceae bacterium]